MSEFFILAVLGAAICIADARKGFYVCLAVGFFQDPVRKLIPGEPVAMTVLVGVFVAVTYAGILGRKEPLSFAPIHAWNPVLERPMTWLIAFVVIQAGRTYLKTGSVVLPAIGMMAYFAPLATLLLGYRLTQGAGDMLRYARFYVVICVALLSGVYFSVTGEDWKLLNPVGEGLHAYSSEGVLELHSGFFRGSELAGWHGATAICLLILILAVSRPPLGTSFLISIAIVLLGLAVFFTGRRKFLVEALLFVATFGALSFYFKRAFTRVGGIVLLIFFAAVIVFQYLLSTHFLEWMDPYLERTAKVQEEAPDRVSGLTVGALQWVLHRNGFWGAGAGMGSQGAQHFGGGAAQVGSAAEGGLGKVLAELGVPGLALVLWLIVSLIRYFWAVMAHVSRDNPEHAPLIFGLVSFLVANALVFAISHQIFGDLFVLLVLGWLAGAALAVPRLTVATAPGDTDGKSRGQRMNGPSGPGDRYAGRPAVRVESPAPGTP